MSNKPMDELNSLSTVWSRLHTKERMDQATKDDLPHILYMNSYAQVQNVSWSFIYNSPVEEK